MSVVNGQAADQNTFNNAFVSKTSDSTVGANINLNDSGDASQGSQVTQVQRELNSLNSFVGKTLNTAKDVKPSWINNGIGTATDDVKTRADVLSGQIVLKESLSNKGAANGYCPLDATSKIDESYLPASITGQLDYKGLWDASTNSPSISDATGQQGYFYYVSVGGTQNLGSGSITFNAGDMAIHNGTIYEKLDGAQLNHKTEFRTLTGGEVTAKQLTLVHTPVNPTEVMLFIKGGTCQFYGDDYAVSGAILDWTGTELDGVLSSGDKLIVQYTYI